MQRAIELEGCFNFRDLGGYPAADGRTVVWRKLFRSDGLHLLSDADVAKLREEVGLGDIVDLRSTHELDTDGRGRLGEEAIRFHHLPLFDGDTREKRRADYDPNQITLAERYFFLADLAKEPISRVLRIMADSDEPVVYHCAAGKDRTGVISAILLSLLGVPDAIIVADYAASRDNLDAIIERLTAARSYRKMFQELPPDTMHAEPETMVNFLAKMADEFGSVREYVVGAGVKDAEIERLRERLLTP